MPLPLAMLALASLPAIQQGISGIGQKVKAGKVKVRDTRPAAHLEELAMRRLAANNQRLPGQGAAEERIAQGEANTYSNALQAGTSGANILAALTQLNRNSAGARNNLSTQAAQFQQNNQDKLAGTLRQDAAYRQNDFQTATREKAALTEASNRNLYSSVSSLASVGMYGLTGGFSGNAGGGMGTPGMRMPGLNSGFSQRQAGYQPPGMVPMMGDEYEYGMGAGYQNNSPYPPYNPMNSIYGLNNLYRR